MDEWTLNDLLECSVCLERLDTSSKVLPCQHTFCKKCLDEIVTTHKELRCPECRILVDCTVEELPPNVLLMRILEGMKNAGNLVPKKKVSNFQKQSPVQISAQQNSPNQAFNNSDSFKPQNSIQKQSHYPPKPYGRAICDYLSKEARDLSFRKGEIIYLHRKVDAQWYQGECGGKTGIFPSSYIQVIVPLSDQVATCKALYDFRMVNDEDEGCLSFRKDDIISVIRRVDENWAEGKLNDHIGIFPLAFVEMNNIAQVLMKISINQPGPSRVAPPTPTTEESTPLIPTDHSAILSNHVSLHPSNQNNLSGHPQQNSTAKALAPTVVTGTESGSTVSSSTSTPSSSSITPNSSSNTSSSSNSEPNSPPSNQSAHGQNPFLTAPSQTPRQMILQTSHITNSAHGILPTSHIMGQQSVIASEQFADPYCHWPSPQTRDVSNFTQHPKEKRHSFSAVSANHHNCSNSNKHGTEVTGSEASSDNQNGQLVRHGSQRHKRSGSDKTSAVTLPAGYIALYPYKPQKADELELKKGGVYLVTERCQDGWFKGTSSKTQKSGMFPGNYVTLAKPLSVGTVQGQPRGISAREAFTPPLTQKVLPQPKYGKLSQMYGRQLVPPELPPRASSPSSRLSRISAQNSSTSWHPQNEFCTLQKNTGESTTSPQANVIAPLSDSRTASSASASPVLNASSSTLKSGEKIKDKKEKSGLIKRLTTIKRSKSPPASASYSMDNPVFDDAPASSQQAPSHSHPVHLRSGSCPSQLIHVSPEGVPNHRTFSASVSARLKPKGRPSISNANFTQSTSRPSESTAYSKPMPSAGSSHRKSNSLDANDMTRKPRQLVPPVRERFRCIVPYPPNSEYELELKVGDIIYVHKKREDGWYKGTQQRTGRTGLFPASFVETY